MFHGEPISDYVRRFTLLFSIPHIIKKLKLMGDKAEA